MTKWQDRVHEIIFEAETPAGKAFDVALLVCIVVSVVTVLFESVASVRARYGDLLRGIEWAFTLLFTVEYVLRLVSVGKPLRYALSFFGIVDLLAIIPTYLSIFIGGAQSLIVIRALRLLRVFRVLKLAHFVGEAQLLRTALLASLRKITVFLGTVLAIVLIVGSLIYLIEGEESRFTSIPQGIYWAIVTLTTVGYGDITSQTVPGKLLASTVMIMGYGIIGVPTGIVTVELAKCPAHVDLDPGVPAVRVGGARHRRRLLQALWGAPVSAGVRVLAAAAVSSLLLISAPEGAADAGELEIVETDQGLEVRDNGQLVLFYQRKVKSLEGRFPRNNYVHPLMSLDGDVLTEDFPEDHPHHRGVFWAWHQLLVDGERVGDGWLLEDFVTDVTEVASRIAADSARIEAIVLWKSPNHRDGKPFIEERSTVTVYRAAPDARAIDFTIALRGLAPGVEIGGSEDPKGYGGFSLRLRLPEGLIFTARNGPVTPQELQIEAGPWMDLSGPYGKDGAVSGVTILTHPSFPGFPQPWILRQRRSMQNPVFPGREAVRVPADHPLVLRYRLVIHRGAARPGDIEEWQRQYAEENAPPGPRAE